MCEAWESSRSWVRKVEGDQSLEFGDRNAVKLVTVNNKAMCHFLYPNYSEGTSAAASLGFVGLIITYHFQKAHGPSMCTLQVLACGSSPFEAVPTCTIGWTLDRLHWQGELKFDWLTDCTLHTCICSSMHALCSTHPTKLKTANQYDKLIAKRPTIFNNFRNHHL